MTIFFNAMHAPLGAHATFTLGAIGKKGGFATEYPTPAYQNVYIGLSKAKGSGAQALPFFDTETDDPSKKYDVDKTANNIQTVVQPISHKQIKRSYGAGVDTFFTKEITFSILSPVKTAPDPSSRSRKHSKSSQRFAYCPSVVAKFTIDNRKCNQARTAFFGVEGSPVGDALQSFSRNNMCGISQGKEWGIFTDAPNCAARNGFSMADILKESPTGNTTFMLGDCSAILISVPPQKKVTIRFAICFFQFGDITDGIICQYYYTHFFSQLSDVAKYTLANFTKFEAAASHSNDAYSKGLSKERRFLLATAIQSYQGSTQLLHSPNGPIWCVNEGEYRMINTLDLTIDHLFYELHQNPWVQKNVLELFRTRFSYRDKVKAADGRQQAGGITFTHDMGVRNVFSDAKSSAYEKGNIAGCFSYMSFEELVNWILCAVVYCHTTNDRAWARSIVPTLKDCLRSLCNRDNPISRNRNGIMNLDGARTGNGFEITTYDSLDAASLGMAKGNLYLAVKTFAAYIALETAFIKDRLPTEAALAASQATKCMKTILSAVQKDGAIPANLHDPQGPRIIPAIEGLVFPHLLDRSDIFDKDGPYAALISALAQHFVTIMKTRDCLCEDGGWKLASSSHNTWLSKIFIGQYVAESILHLDRKKDRIKADKAHMSWLLQKENVEFAFSDQIQNKVAVGSKYYPRGVTSILFLQQYKKGETQ